MSTTFTLILVAAIIGVVLFFIQQKSAIGVDGPWPFYSRKPLSVPEQVLYFKLLKALPERIILCQVALSRLLGVKKGHNFRAWQNRIDRMTADFVVCSMDSSVIAVIELDDATHDSERRRDADAKKNKAFAAAGIRVVRWQAKALPDEGTIRAAFLQTASAAINDR